MFYNYRTALHLFRKFSIQEQVDVPTFHLPEVDIGIGIMSHPDNFERRAKLRNQCFPRYSAAKATYKFFVGRPSEKDGGTILTAQGQHATFNERTSASRVLNESRLEKDIVFLPVREHYRDTTDKVIGMYRHMIEDGADVLAKVDDDMCIDAEAVRQDVRAAESATIYGGTHHFEGR